MTWEWWVTTILAAIAALGVVVNEIRHRRNRPVINVRARATKKNPAPQMRAFGPGEWLMEIRNFGTVEALDITAIGFGLELLRGEQGTPIGRRLAPGESFEFSATPTGPGGVEHAWILLMYMTPATPHGKSEWAWWPALDLGELADIRRRQLKRSFLKRRLARFGYPDQTAHPMTFAHTRGPALSQQVLTYDPEAEKPRVKERRARFAHRWLREPLPDWIPRTTAE